MKSWNRQFISNYQNNVNNTFNPHLNKYNTLSYNSNQTNLGNNNKGPLFPKTNEIKGASDVMQKNEYKKYVNFETDSDISFDQLNLPENLRRPNPKRLIVNKIQQQEFQPNVFLPIKVNKEKKLSNLILNSSNNNLSKKNNNANVSSTKSAQNVKIKFPGSKHIKNKSIQLRNNFSINKNLDFNIEDENQSYQISNTEMPYPDNKKNLDTFDNRRLNDNLNTLDNKLANISKEPALYSYNPNQPTVLHKYNVKTLNYPKNNSLSEIKNKQRGQHIRSSSDYNFNSIVQKRQIGNQLIDPLQNPSVLNILSNIFDEPNASNPSYPPQEPIIDYVNTVKENPYTGGRIDLNTMKNIKLNNPKYELELLKLKYSNKMHLIKRIQRFYKKYYNNKKYNIILIQSIWRGYWLRNTVYNNLMRYYKGVALERHLLLFLEKFLKNTFKSLLNKLNYVQNYDFQKQQTLYPYYNPVNFNNNQHSDIVNRIRELNITPKKAGENQRILYNHHLNYKSNILYNKFLCIQKIENFEYKGMNLDKYYQLVTKNLTGKAKKDKEYEKLYRNLLTQIEDLKKYKKFNTNLFKIESYTELINSEGLDNLKAINNSKKNYNFLKKEKPQKLKLNQQYENELNEYNNYYKPSKLNKKEKINFDDYDIEDSEKENELSLSTNQIDDIIFKNRENDPIISKSLNLNFKNITQDINKENNEK